MGHWEMTTKVPKKEFKTWFPQHLSLGTKEQRRFQDPDVEGRRDEVYARRLKALASRGTNGRHQ
jgi:hypothetical protein